MKFYSQRDAMDCGPACLMMTAAHHGRHYPLPYLRDGPQGIAILLEPTPEFYQTDPPQPAGKAQLGRLLGYARPYRALVGQVMIGMVLASALALIFPFLTQSIVDFGIDNRNLGFIYIVLLAQLALFFSQITVQFLQSRILLFIGARINVAMVSDFLRRLMRLPLGFFDAKMTGDLLQRIGDQERIEAFLTRTALPVLFALLNFVIFSGILLLYNPLIFGVFMLAAFCYVLWIVFFLRRRRELDYVRFREASANNNTLIEMIQGMQEIKLQGSERKRRDIWAGIQARLFRVNLASLNLAQWQDAGAAFINQTKNIVITFLAAKAVIEGRMTLGMMLAIQYMVGQLDAPLQQFIAFIRAAQDARISLERIGELQDQPDEDTAQRPDRTADPAGYETPIAPPVAADIVLENVSFRYNALNDDVLRNIDLRIPGGKVTAIVGMSGSGKTTLIKLLLGFYNPVKGRIRVGGMPFETIRPALWRQHCGAVMQDGFIFSDTIAHNIAECAERPDTAQLLRAAEIANIREFVDDLPLGYNTKIGMQGNGISQGQRQRLLIARAVYKDPGYLFFDEATNALDANNERAIVENLQAFYQNRTVVVVAHRLSTVRHADQIVVLDKGAVMEMGTHAELVARRGVYYALVKNQLELD